MTLSSENPDDPGRDNAALDWRRVRNTLTVLVIAPADMLLFAAVIREGSFTKAGRSFGITKQSVSERVSKLERELGVRLLERTTRSLRSTDSGARYYERCAIIAAEVDEANREVQRIQLEPTGLLRVSAPVLYGRAYLAPIVAEFLTRYPKLRIDLVLADRRVNLIEEGFDVVVRVGDLDDSSLTARKIGEGFVYLVATPRYLATHGTPRTAEALERARCISSTQAERWQVFGRQVKIDPVLLVNDLEAACAATLQHIGIARLPSVVCGEHLARKRLRLAFPHEKPLVRPIHAVYPSRQYLAPKVRLFVEALAESQTNEGRRTARSRRRG